MRAIVLGLAVAVSLVGLPMLSDVASADCRDVIDLSATSDGEDVDASGRAEIRSNESDAQQTLTVEAGVSVPDGTPLFVFANGQPAGAATVDLGVATLTLSSVPGTPLPGGVDSVCSIGPVWVTDARGTALLTGSF